MARKRNEASGALYTIDVWIPNELAFLIGGRAQLSAKSSGPVANRLHTACPAFIFL